MEHPVLKLETSDLANLETCIKLQSVVEKAKLKILTLYSQIPSSLRTYRLKIADAELSIALHELETFKKAAVKKSIDEYLEEAFFQPK